MNFLTYGKLVAAQLTQETSTNHFFRRENENKGFTHISYQPDIPYTPFFLGSHINSVEQ
jgi:hypothetical protein